MSCYFPSYVLVLVFLAFIGIEGLEMWRYLIYGSDSSLQPSFHLQHKKGRPKYFNKISLTCWRGDLLIAMLLVLGDSTNHHGVCDWLISPTFTNLHEICQCDLVALECYGGSWGIGHLQSSWAFQDQGLLLAWFYRCIQLTERIVGHIPVSHLISKGTIWTGLSCVLTEHRTLYNNCLLTP